MKTKITKEGDMTVVSMDGKLDFENAEPLRERLTALANRVKTDSTSKIIFNFENLEFVGSSGISSFVQSLKEFSEHASTKPRYCNVRSEFRRIMKAYDEKELFEFYDNEERAKRSFDQ